MLPKHFTISSHWSWNNKETLDQYFQNTTDKHKVGVYKGVSQGPAIRKCCRICNWGGGKSSSSRTYQTLQQLKQIKVESYRTKSCPELCLETKRRDLWLRNPDVNKWFWRFSGVWNETIPCGPGKTHVVWQNMRI